MPTASEYVNETAQSAVQLEPTNKLQLRLRYLGMAGFLFFAIKGVIWLLVGAASLFLYAS